MKNLVVQCFFSPKFSIYGGILAQKIYRAGTIFCQSSDVKNKGQSQQPSIISQLATGEPQHIELSIRKRANLIFQWISLSNATLLSIVFFACGVHKLNYIKNFV